MGDFLQFNSPILFFKQIYILVDFLNFSWFCKKYIDLHYILQTPTISQVLPNVHSLPQRTLDSSFVMKLNR